MASFVRALTSPTERLAGRSPRSDLRGSSRPARQRYLQAINCARVPAIVFGNLVVTFLWLVQDVIQPEVAVSFLIAGTAALALSLPYARLTRSRNLAVPAYTMLIIDTLIVGFGAWIVGNSATGIPVFFSLTIVASALVIGGLGSAIVAIIASLLYACSLILEGSWAAHPAASWGALGFHTGAFLTLALVSTLLMRELNQALERARRLRREAEVIHQINRLTDRDPSPRRLFRTTQRMLKLVLGLESCGLWRVNSEGYLAEGSGDGLLPADPPDDRSITPLRFLADPAPRQIVELIGSLDRPSGLLVARFGAPGPAQADREFLRRVAGHLALSLEKVQLQSAKQAAEALLQATYAPITSLSLATVGAAIAEQGAILTAADLACVGLTDLPGTPIARTGPHWTESAGTLARLLQQEPRLLDQVLLSLEPLTAEQLSRLGFPEAARWIGSALGVTFEMYGERLGYLVVARATDRAAFDSADLAAVRAFAERSAQAIQNARLYEHLKCQIEEVRRTQAQLVQSAKLAAIGELAANVAHEINNPLTGILMNVSLALEAAADAPEAPAATELQVIQDEALRAREIVRNLLDFARQTATRQEPVDLNAILDQTLALVSRYLESNRVRVRCDFAPHLPPVSADANQLKQVLLNLINNAIQAMPEGGELSLVTAYDRNAVAVRVSDTGIGIPPEHLGRVFEPFFSTKEDVKGTGLGLSVSHGIIAQHGGTIGVSSEVGRGTTFRVALPVATSRESI